jgi:two-component system, LuxR family, response regulator FixJ
MNDYQVYIVDDDEALCEALGYLLKSEGLPVETFNSAQQFLDRFDPLRPAVLILDVRMRGMDGLTLQQYLKDRGDKIPIIILTGHGDIPMAVKSIKAGAVEFLQKPVNDHALFKCLYEAIDQDKINRETSRRLQEIEIKLESLTRREREVMDLVVEGLANKHVAERLSVSEKTIEVHRKHLMHKMGASSVIELVTMILWYRAHKNGTS